MRAMTTFASDGSTITPAAPTLDQAEQSGHPTTHLPRPEPGTIEPEVIESEPAAEVAVPTSTEVVDPDAEEKWTHQAEWKHDWLDFKGDTLGIRVPKGSALQALGAARHNSLEFQDRLLNLFIAKHLSPESYERVFYRMINPDDEEFTTSDWGELINAIAEIGGERARAEAEALAEVQNGKPSKGK